MFLQPPPETAAVAALYQREHPDEGYVMNLTRLWAWRPEVSDAFTALRGQLTGASALTPRDLGVLVCATAGRLGDAYCALAWGERLARTAGANVAAAVLQGVPDDALTARDRALADWARKVATAPNDTTPADVQQLRDVGLTDQTIFEATAFVGLRVAFSSVNDALGARPDRQLADAAPEPVRQAVRFGRPVAASAS